MSNVWNVTELEFRQARKRSDDNTFTEEERKDYWQLVRFYRNEIFIRDAAARAVQRLRGLKVAHATR